jgi:hypothetical protein
MIELKPPSFRSTQQRILSIKYWNVSEYILYECEPGMYGETFHSLSNTQTSYCTTKLLFSFHSTSSWVQLSLIKPIAGDFKIVGQSAGVINVERSLFRKPGGGSTIIALPSCTPSLRIRGFVWEVKNPGTGGYITAAGTLTRSSRVEWLFFTKMLWKHTAKFCICETNPRGAERLLCSIFMSHTRFQSTRVDSAIVPPTYL